MHSNCWCSNTLPLIPRNKYLVDKMTFKTDIPCQLNKSQRVLLTADQHYFHKNIIKYANRHYADVISMNRDIRERHNAIVRPSDHIIMIGDFFFGTAGELRAWLRGLNGNIYLIDGSHDRALEKAVNDGGFPGMPVTVLPKLFEFKYGGWKITLCHYAMTRWWASHHEGSCHFFGHSHGHYKHPCRAIDVGVDCHNYSPIFLDDAINMVKNKPLFENHPGQKK